MDLWGEITSSMLWYSFYYGITQDPVKKDYMLIMEYASGGNLHNYLRENFANIKWNTKLAILIQISDG